MSRLRPLLRRRRLARLVARAHSARSALVREWRWLRRDLRDLRLELRRYRVDAGVLGPIGEPTSRRGLSLYVFGRSFGWPPRTARRRDYSGQIGVSGQKQIETIADLVSDTVSTTAHIEQTHSETGGTHTYVRTGGGLWHVAAKSGRAVELEQ